MRSTLLLFFCFCSLVLRAQDDAAVVEKRVKGATYEYVHETVADVPWSIHIFKISRADPDLVIATTFGNGTEFAMDVVSEQMKALPAGWGEPLAAVNGDFYDKRPSFEGRPRDLQISNGELVSGPANHACFWIDTNGLPHMTNLISLFKVVWEDGSATPLALNEERAADAAVLYTHVVGGSTHSANGTELLLEAAGKGPWLPLRPQSHYTARIKDINTQGDTPIGNDQMVLSLGTKLVTLIPVPKAGSTVRLATDTFPSLAGARVAISGGPSLVRGGKALAWDGILFRHPRTAIGWNKDYYYLVEVDGRQHTLSVGMTFPEFSAYLVRLGCEEALNLDGGGSATLWALGKVQNSPSEGRERPCPNTIVFLHRKAGHTTANP